MTAKNAPEQLVRIGALQSLDNLLRQFGLDAETELASLGLNPVMFQHAEVLVHIHLLGELLEHFARVTNCQDFSLRLAAAQDISMSGALAVLLQTSSTLGEALQEIGRFQHLHHAQPVIWQLEDVESSVSFNIYLKTQSLSPLQRRLVADLGLAQVCLVISRLSAGRVAPACVRLQSSSGDRFSSYSRFFQVPLEFDAQRDGLVFAPGALDFSLRHPDTKLHELMQEKLPSISAEPGDSSLVRGVRAIIRSLLPTGDYGLDKVARCYDCDKRTLQRYLRDEAATSYQVLLDEVRFDLVKQYLCNSSMPMTQLTYLAGFTDPSNFTRAFHKRFGMPPRQWREQHTDRKPGGRRRRPGLHLKQY